MTNITTNLTPKQRLSHPVAFGNMTTFRAFLPCPTRWDKLNTNTIPCSLVRQEELQLPERPRVNLLAFMPVLLYLFGLLVSNVGQVFQYQNVASLTVGYNLFRDAMVGIPTETVLSTRKPRQVSFSRMSLALKDGPQSLITSLDYLNMLSSVELSCGQDSRIVNPSVNANNVPRSRWSSNVFLEDNVQKNLVVLNHKVSRTPFPREILLEILRNSEVDFQTPRCS